MATGEWVAWLNADDVYLPGSFLKVAEAASPKNEPITWIVGTTIYTNSELIETGRFVPSLYTSHGHDSHYEQLGWINFVCTKQSGIALPQPSSFWKRSTVMEAGGIDESLNYAMDHELYGRLAYHGYRPVLLKEALACFRKHENQKTTKFPVAFWEEELTIANNWVRMTNGTEKQALEKYASWLQRKIKNYPYLSSYKSLLSWFKKIVKILFPSDKKNKGNY